MIQLNSRSHCEKKNEKNHKNEVHQESGFYFTYVEKKTPKM